jgi:hypothetical protein
MIPPYTYAAGRLAEEHVQQRARDGEHAHLTRVARPVRRGRTHPVLARIGAWLMSAGERLQVGYAPFCTHFGGSAS